MANRYAMHSGQLIDIENLKPEHIHLDDIAHHLAKIQRYAGAMPINITYSVGEHCINLYNHIKILEDVAEYWDPTEKNVLLKIALLHDAAETYIVDLPSPLKSCLPDYKKLEYNVEKIISQRFNLSIHSKLISIYDKRILIDEVKTIMPDKLELYKKETGLEELNTEILYNQHPSTVKQCFLNICKQLGIE